MRTHARADIRLLRSLASFLVAMQQRNGLFYNKVVLLPQPDAARATKAPVMEGEASHAGLAIYALLLLADLDREQIDGVRLPSRCVY